MIISCRSQKNGALIAFALVMSISTAAFAVSITVKQDSTFAGETGSDSRDFTYYQIFRATKSATSTTSGGGYDTDGTPGATTVTPSTGVGYSYYLTTADDSARIAQLGQWVAATGTPGQEGYVAAHWEKAAGNNWFKLTPSSDGSQYVVEWDNTNTDTDTAQAAAAWLAGKTGETANYTPITSGSLTWDSTNKQWAATGLAEGYYLISSDTGNNLIAATTDININEKNSYPPLDKTQADEDDTTQSDTVRDVAVGDVLTYEVKVTIPQTVKVGDRILVWDKASQGLTYNDDVAVKTGSNTGNATVADAAAADAVTGAAWTKVITITDLAQKGTDVVFTFTMTVNENALVDTGKTNESGLKYGDENDWSYESKPDHVEYKTYFAGIHKVDGADKTKDLAGVEFTLKEAGTPFYVKPVTETTGEGESAVTTTLYYVSCASTETGATTTVVTNAEGLILIRGLDEDKAYTLTETKTLDGYNLLDADVPLTLYEDTVTVTETTEGGETTTSTTTSFDPAKTNSKWGEVENNSGTVLPSTGGIGTTIFYVVGSILVVAAGVLLITKKRMSREG